MNTKDVVASEANILKDCVRGIRSLPFCENVAIVFIPENTGKEGGYMQYHLNNANISNVWTMAKCAGGKLGVPRNRENANRMYCLTRSYLAERKVSFARHMVSLSKTIPEAKRQLYKQLENFVFDPDEQNDPRKPASGKLHGKIGGENDDLVIAFQQAFYWRQVFLEDQSVHCVKFKEDNAIAF